MKVDPNSFSTIDIATSGLRAYDRQMKLIGSNMANIQTTDAGNGEPYRRLIAEFETNTDDGGGVDIKDIVQDQSPFQKVFNPGHPDADEDGYVSMPNVNWASEMVNLNAASRAYQANAAILRRYQKMVESSLELLR
ncbi:MAG: flagellar basal body rod protein FlgC [Phycisphaerae bacterium]|nr:flagellar basal body rod protein FlgC [Phycisphaerae bacterium]